MLQEAGDLNLCECIVRSTIVCLIVAVGYRRTVLVVWPAWSDCAVLYAGHDGTLRMINEVKSFTDA